MEKEKEIDKRDYVKGKDYIMRWLLKLLWNKTESETIDWVNNGRSSDNLDDELKTLLIDMSKYLDKIKLENPNLEFDHIEFEKDKNELIFYKN